MVSFPHSKSAFKVVALTFCKVIIKVNDTDAEHTWPGEKRNCCEVKWVRGTFESRLDALGLCKFFKTSSKFALVVRRKIK